jgi:hypothetical protein
MQFVQLLPENTALYKVMQEHLLTFEQKWTDQASGHTLPEFVLDELHGFMSCGILGRGFAHLFCHTCHEHYAVAFSCKARAVCPSCLGRRMNEGAFNLVDHVSPNVPICLSAGRDCTPPTRPEREHRPDSQPGRWAYALGLPADGG